jgi:hypothetical protein
VVGFVLLIYQCFLLTGRPSVTVVQFVFEELREEKGSGEDNNLAEGAHGCARFD